MKAIRNRLANHSDEGLTLIEVLVAMMFFAIIAVGVAWTLTTSLVTTRDAKAREVAANLAAQDIDYARSVDDVTAVLDQVTSKTIDGITYTITRTTGWISSNGADATCGSAGGVLLYKHVNDRVTWTGARTPTTKVQADTLIAPNGRINNPDLGTILVSVLGANGAGMPGITVSATPSTTAPNGAVAVTSTPDATDTQGCSYILQVTPGNYVVSVTKTGYLSDAQLATPTKTVAVVAGNSSEADFQYDQAASFPTTFASNIVTAGINFPDALDVNFASQNSIYSKTVTVPSSKVVTTSLHPFAGGYSVFTGDYVAPSVNGTGVNQPNCISPDPGAWPANAAGVAGNRSEAVGAAPGASQPLGAVMRVVTANTAAGVYLTAKSSVASASVGDPGCATSLAMTYRFSTKTTTTSTLLALPFGTWTLYTGSSAGATTTVVPTASVALPAGSPANTTAGVFTLDPRVVQ